MGRRAGAESILGARAAGRAGRRTAGANKYALRKLDVSQAARERGTGAPLPQQAAERPVQTCRLSPAAGLLAGKLQRKFPQQHWQARPGPARLGSASLFRVARARPT